MKKGEWKKIYIKTMTNRGLSKKEALENYEAGNHDFNDSPKDQADDLISYMIQESEGT